MAHIALVIFSLCYLCSCMELASMNYAFYTISEVDTYEGRGKLKHLMYLYPFYISFYFVESSDTMLHLLETWMCIVLYIGMRIFIQMTCLMNAFRSSSIQDLTWIADTSMIIKISCRLLYKTVCSNVLIYSGLQLPSLQEICSESSLQMLKIVLASILLSRRSWYLNCSLVSTSLTHQNEGSSLLTLNAS